jgi:hypothetical protein
MGILSMACVSRIRFLSSSYDLEPIQDEGEKYHSPTRSMKGKTAETLTAQHTLFRLRLESAI